MTEAAAKYFQNARWQRCQVHLMRNILGQCANKHRADVAAGAKLVLQATDMAEAKSVACLEDGFEDAMAVMALPEKYRKRLRSMNMQERLNEEDH